MSESEYHTPIEDVDHNGPSDLVLFVPAPSAAQFAAVQAEVTRLTAELSHERAMNTRFLAERAEAIHSSRIESARLTAQLDSERAISARLLESCDQLLDDACQHVQLSSHLGEYTSAFLDIKTCCERAALLGSIRATTKMVWDGGVEMTHASTIKLIRLMMAQHGFVFRDPGEGKTGWNGYAMMVPHVDTREQLDRVVRTHREDMNMEVWYLAELVAVLMAVVKYLQENP